MVWYQLLKQLEALARQAVPSREEQEQQVSAVLHAGCSVLWGTADGNSPSLFFICLPLFLTVWINTGGLCSQGSVNTPRQPRRALLQGRVKEAVM